MINYIFLPLQSDTNEPLAYSVIDGYRHAKKFHFLYFRMYACKHKHIHKCVMSLKYVYSFSVKPIKKTLMLLYYTALRPPKWIFQCLASVTALF